MPTADRRVRERTGAIARRSIAPVDMREVDDVVVRSSWIWALAEEDAREGAGFRTRGKQTVERIRARMTTPTRAGGADGGARGDASKRGAGATRRPFGAHVGGYSDASSSDGEPTPSATRPPRAHARAETSRRDGGGSRGATTSSAKLRALSKEAACFREELTKEKRRRERAEGKLEELSGECVKLKREHAALRYSHDKLKETKDGDDDERKRQIRALKKKLTKTLERESKQRRRSVSTLKMALDALRSFAPTAPSGRALGGSAVSAVIAELSALTEAIALRDSLAMEEDDNAPATRETIASSWSVAEIERAKAQVEILERELGDAHEIIRTSEKERVILERELASARREIHAQAARHDDDIRVATEATSRAIEMVREQREDVEQRDSRADAPSPRVSSPPSPLARDLRADMDVLERELAQLHHHMAEALAEVEDIA